ncbi:MAG: N-acetyltransferase [Cyanobacteriota bacterium]|nr:N-acetyltransferase [Cyanobacteriota bacterium]
MNITFVEYNAGDESEISILFSEVFTDSEGSEEGKLIENLVDEIFTTTEEEDFYCFVALCDRLLAGCIFFTRLTFDSSTEAFVLGPVAVSTRFQNRGIGQNLIKHGIAQLKRNSVDFILTYGDPQFYAKVGFERVSENEVKAPFQLRMPEGWQMYSLNGNSPKFLTGKPACVSAFNDVRYW